MIGNRRRPVVSAVRFAVTMAVLLLGASAGQAQQPCTTTVAAGGDIQAAIDTATSGDEIVICLEAGHYEPTEIIDIWIPLTLQGPQCGVDPRGCRVGDRVPGDVTTEAVIDGLAGELGEIIQIHADDVELCGLDVMNGSGDLIESETDTPVARTVIRENIIHNATGDEGIQLRACTDCLVETNFITNVQEDAVCVCCGSEGVVVRRNEILNSDTQNAAIYLYGAGGDHQVIENVITNVTGNDGIMLGDDNCDEAVAGTIVQGNIITDISDRAIVDLSSDTSILNNEVDNVRIAVFVSCDGTANVTIEDNYLGDCSGSNSVEVGDLAESEFPDASTVTFNNNCLSDPSVGLTNHDAGLLDATNNWWGAADGPSGDGSGSGVPVFGNIDYDPFLTTDTCELAETEPPLQCPVDCPICPDAVDCAADADEDGIPDECDICSDGPDDVDTDEDGVPDACDICAEGPDAADADGDGVPDDCDLCPDDNPDDTDGDGVCDSDDPCPNVAGSDDGGDGNACDDGNEESGDGCFECQVEEGWECSGEPSLCGAVCGDGLIDGDEICDDGNDASDDGCFECEVEDGWECIGSPIVCSTICGDGLVDGDEACDDGNDASDDGCSACAVEEGWICDDSEPTECQRDSDGDGIFDDEDNCPEDSNPFQADLDEDGLGDRCDPDRDGDGVDDLDEIDISTDPTVADSDNDGLTDGEEVELGTDPNNPDSDFGGIEDGYEVHRGTDPLNMDDDIPVERATSDCGCASANSQDTQSTSLLAIVALLWVVGRRRQRVR